MNNEISFHEKSYRQNSEHYQMYSLIGDNSTHAKTWLENDTVDAWRHQRMYKTLDPILKSEPTAKWLTIGDGRYGNDAKYIMGNGCYAMASDISDVLLKEAKDAGYIPEYSKENAEELSFGDSSYDYVLCKESYHHFPRPMLALYEMLRVASKGVMLIEPSDVYINDKLFGMLLFKSINFIKALFGRKYSKHNYEESGNYSYSLSVREIEKVALGLNYNFIAFKGVNDAYFGGVEYEKLSENGPLQKKVKNKINKLNLLCRLGVLDYGVLTSIIFKQKPSNEVFQRLTEDGFEIIVLPSNPYVCDL